MNLPKMFNKWWLILVHGLLLLLFSYFLFSNAERLFTASVTVAGVIALITGTVAVAGYFLTGNYERTKVDLFAGIFSCLAGLFFLNGASFSQELITWFFAAFMIFNTVVLVNSSWELKSEISWWWLAMLLLLYTLVVLYCFFTGTTLLNISLSVLAGVQFFATGLLMMVLAFAVRKLQQEYSKTISQIRNQQAL